MNPDKLTKRQSEVLGFLVSYVRTNQRPPSIREIGEKFGIMSPNGVVWHLKALEKKGYIERDEKVARGIRIVQQGSRA